MVDYIGAIKRPFSDWKKLSIGAMIYVIPVLNLVTQFFAGGYLIECASTAMKREKTLPEWKDAGSLFVKGFLMMVIIFLYLLPVIVLAFVFGGAALLSALGVGGISSTPNPDTMGLGIILICLLMILTVYFLPMAVLIFVDKGTLVSAFSFGEVYRKCLTKKYFIAWLIMIIYVSIISSVVLTANILLSLISILPFIVMAFMSIVLGITGMTILGEVYSEIQ